MSKWKTKEQSQQEKETKETPIKVEPSKEIVQEPLRTHFKLRSISPNLEISQIEDGKQMISVKRAQLLWSGSKSFIGISEGNVSFSVKIKNGNHFRLGWSSSTSKKELGEDEYSFGLDEGGNLINCGEVKQKEESLTYKVGCFILCCLNLSERNISFAKNGGRTKVLAKLPDNLTESVTWFPHICTKDGSLDVYLDAHTSLPKGYVWIARSVPILEPVTTPKAPNLTSLSRASTIDLSPEESGQVPPPSNKLLWEVPDATKIHVQNLWNSRGGQQGAVEAVWQIKNPYLESIHENCKKEMLDQYKRRPDILEGFHGTASTNILPICQYGFNRDKRRVMVYGEGDYFAKNPTVSVGYCKGDCYMLVCSLVLGTQKINPSDEYGDHIWVNECKYYVMKDSSQILPVYVIKFKNYYSSNGGALDALVNKLSDDVSESLLKKKLLGAKEPGRFHRKCKMEAESTKHLWVGYLDPTLTDEQIEMDVRSYLPELNIVSVKPIHESLRRCARIELSVPVSKEEVLEFNKRKYRGHYDICVDDVQPNNPAHATEVCPRLRGPNRYCRLQYIRYCDDGCDYDHPSEWRATSKASFRLELIRFGSAKGDEVQQHFLETFESNMGFRPRIISIKKINNRTLNTQYERRKLYQNEKHGRIGSECELYHGTNCNILDDIYTHGLRSPSDYEADDRCPVSGGKGLCTSLCDNRCQYCTKPHKWSNCHMFGLGIYLADQSSKSHRYVTNPIHQDGQLVYKIIKCRVALGSPYLIEGHLNQQDALHDVIYPKDISSSIRQLSPQEWVKEDHDSFYVRGLGPMAIPGKSVINSEYIVFCPWQVLPIYEISYTI